MTRSKARRLREIIEQAVENLDDETAAEAVELFPKADKKGKKIKKGKRYNFNGELVCANEDFEFSGDMTADEAKALWKYLKKKDKEDKDKK